MIRLPEAIGKAYWRGGQGRPGEYGGWGYKCAFCLTGQRLKSMPRKSRAVAELIEHVTKAHPRREIVIDGKLTTVAGWIESTTKGTD